MTFQDVQAEYDRQYQAQCRAQEAHTQTPEYQAWLASRAGQPNRPKLPPYKGIYVDYGRINELLVAACVTAGFTAAQAQCIVNHADYEKHACYEDVLSYTQTLCEFLKQYARVKETP